MTVIHGEIHKSKDTSIWGMVGDVLKGILQGAVEVLPAAADVWLSYDAARQQGVPMQGLNVPYTRQNVQFYELPAETNPYSQFASLQSAYAQFPTPFPTLPNYSSAQHRLFADNSFEPTIQYRGMTIPASHLDEVAASDLLYASHQVPLLQPQEIQNWPLERARHLAEVQTASNYYQQLLANELHPPVARPSLSPVWPAPPTPSNNSIDYQTWQNKVTQTAQAIANFLILEDIRTLQNPKAPLWQKGLAIASFFPVGRVIKGPKFLTKVIGKSEGAIARLAEKGLSLNQIEKYKKFVRARGSRIEIKIFQLLKEAIILQAKKQGENRASYALHQKIILKNGKTILYGRQTRTELDQFLHWHEDFPVDELEIKDIDQFFNRMKNILGNEGIEY